LDARWILLRIISIGLLLAVEFGGSHDLDHSLLFFCDINN
jgi:hypothetical protein